MASQEQYSIPSDYLKIEAVFIYNTTTGHKVKLRPMLVTQRDATKSPGNPSHYYIWGLNVSGVNSYYVGLNPIPSSSGTSDLEIYYRQQPQTMVAGGTAPEILTPWQDGLISFACWKVYRRRGKEWLNAALEAKAEWEDWVSKAKAYINPLQLDWPTEVTDTGGYLYNYGA